MWGRVAKLKLLYIMNRRDIYNRFDGHCAYCGKKIEFDDMTIDHILPHSKGGKDMYTMGTVPFV